MIRLYSLLALTLALCVAVPAQSQNRPQIIHLGASEIPNLLSATDSTGRLQVLHNAIDPGIATLDVYANGVRLSGPDGLAFRTGTAFVPVVTGTSVTVVVVAGGASATDTLAVATYVAESGVDHRVIVGGGGQNLVAQVFPNAVSLVPGEPRISLNIYNGAADGTSFSYDVFVNNGGGFFGLTAFSGSRPQRFIVPVNEYNIRVRMAGFPDRIYTPADFQVPAGGTSLFFSSGNRASATAPLGLFVLTDDGAVVRLEAFPVASESVPLRAVGLSAWPNPVRASVSLVTEAPGPVRASALDALGREVWTGALLSGSPLRVDVSGWPAGRYVVRTDDAQTALTVVH